MSSRQTLEKFKAIPPQPGQTSPLLIYFGTLLTRGKLNAHESVELSQLVIQQNKKHLLDNWLKVRPFPCEDGPMRCSISLNMACLPGTRSLLLSQTVQMLPLLIFCNPARLVALPVVLEGVLSSCPPEALQSYCHNPRSS